MSFLFISVSSISKIYFLNFYKKKKETFPFFENIKMSSKRIKTPTNFKEKENNCIESG